MKRVWIYDLETLPGLFTATFIDRDSDDSKIFILSKTINQIKQLIDFLHNEVKGLIGYNNLRFDAQVIEFILVNPDCTADDICAYAQTLIDDNQKIPDYPEWKLSIPNLDLFKINHFDNKNRRSSLKWIEFMLDLPNIEDMPERTTESDKDWTEKVFGYNYNDVVATKALLDKTKDMIELRKSLSKIYNMKMLNYSNSRIGSELLLKLYCKKTGLNPKEVRQMRTHRSVIKIEDIIFPYIYFNSEEFNYLLNTFKSTVITKDTKKFELSVVYKGFQFDYGMGGIHGSIHNKKITADDNYAIIDADVNSLYPSIAVVNKMYPQHLGPAFYQVYKHDIVDVRLTEKAKKEAGNKAIISGFKESANASYGKSQDIYSWMYDPKYTFQTTVNGQLMLTMLAEWLLDNISDMQIIQVNTDGITVRINRNEINKYYEICKKWEEYTKLQLEFADYDLMVITDVNNYLSRYTSGKTKCKGRYEYKDIPLHKNKSHNIIPIAFFNYFIKGIPVEETILNHRNIYDFCAGVKTSKSDKRDKSHYELHSIQGSELNKEKLNGRVVRYYVSKKGKYLMKVYEDNTIEQVEAPTKSGKFRKEWRVTYFNKAFFPERFEDYNIDYTYYIYKTKALIADIEDKSQQQLFAA